MNHGPPNLGNKLQQHANGPGTASIDIDLHAGASPPAAASTS